MYRKPMTRTVESLIEEAREVLAEDKKICPSIWNACYCRQAVTKMIKIMHAAGEIERCGDGSKQWQAAPVPALKIFAA